MFWRMSIMILFWPKFNRTKSVDDFRKGCLDVGSIPTSSTQVDFRLKTLIHSEDVTKPYAARAFESISTLPTTAPQMGFPAPPPMRCPIKIEPPIFFSAAHNKMSVGCIFKQGVDWIWQHSSMRVRGFQANQTAKQKLSHCVVAIVQCEQLPKKTAQWREPHTKVGAFFLFYHCFCLKIGNFILKSKIIDEKFCRLKYYS